MMEQEEDKRRRVEEEVVRLGSRVEGVGEEVGRSKAGIDTILQRLEQMVRTSLALSVNYLEVVLMVMMCRRSCLLNPQER